jgi:catechol 2,3-dioxygenase-like lactoylglutathione lyase family enzyme
MGFRNISHVAIGVSDMDKALGFWRDLLGMVVSKDDTEVFDGYGDLAPHTRRGVYLRWSEGDDEAFIVLDYHDRGVDPDPRQFYGMGIHHFGFWVDDARAIHARAVEQGVPVVVPPGDSDSLLFGEKPGRTMRTCILKDPDGNIIQFDQRVT